MPVSELLESEDEEGYMDKSDKTARAEGKLRDAGNSDDPDDEERQAQAMTMKFSRGDSNSAQKMKEKSYDHQMKKVEEEPWLE